MTPEQVSLSPDYHTIPTGGLQTTINQTPQHHRSSLTLELELMTRQCKYEWFTRFREGRERVSDKTHSDRQATSVSNENIEKVRKLITKDPRLTVHMIAGR
ncbi:hypothetical protein TNCV_4638311 [Trichonephila clavipes]|uniref:HTH_48 domain-containing protein n=1 Tax=Trichonephila clavipes TaxID=2585209 RepID=A0A8X6WDE9_TRICX|nr:hypothetical protein TNCV_4638311 [Trichonephila clavipes]